MSLDLDAIRERFAHRSDGDAHQVMALLKEVESLRIARDAIEALDDAHREEAEKAWAEFHKGVGIATLLTTERNKAEAAVATLREALVELTHLYFEIRDTPEYRERKEPAWEAARAALASTTEVAGGN